MSTAIPSIPSASTPTALCPRSVVHAERGAAAAPRNRHGRRNAYQEGRARGHAPLCAGKPDAEKNSPVDAHRRSAYAQVVQTPQDKREAIRALSDQLEQAGISTADWGEGQAKTLRLL